VVEVPGALPHGGDERLAALLEHATELVRSAVHELRTPLAAIAMAAQGARRRPECQVAARGLDTILRSCERMDSMLRDLVAAGRLDLLAREPEPQPVECSPFIEELVARQSDGLGARHVHVVVGEPRPAVRVDPKQFEQILEIALTTVLGSSDAGSHPVVEASVADDGVEITVRAECASDVAGSSVSPPTREATGGDALSSRARSLRMLLLRLLVEANRGTVAIDNESGPLTGLRLRLVRAIGDADQPAAGA
jgi:K+-sensing histidine kinase KdpD